MDDLKVAHKENLDESYQTEIEKLVPVDMIKLVKQKKSKVYCALDDERILIGILVADLSGNEHEIQYIFVDPDYRRQGVGSALLQYLVMEHAISGHFKPLVMFYPDGEKYEAFRDFLMSQPNFAWKSVDDKSGKKNVTKAFWIGMTVDEMNDLFNLNLDVDIDYYHNLSLETDDGGDEVMDNYLESDEYVYMEDLDETLTMDD